MAGKASASSAGPLMVGGGGEASPRYSLPEAISKIQMFSLVHKMGEKIPVEFLVFKEKISFWVVGFKGILLDLVLAALFTPFSLAVMNHLIPIFGTHDPNLFDKVFACILSGAYSIGFNVMLGYNLGTCYFGRVPIMAIRTMLGGFLSAQIIKLIILFPFFHFLPDWINPHNVASFLEKHWNFVRPFMSVETAQHLVWWLGDVREVFIRSWYLVFGMTLLSFAIPLVVFFVGRQKARHEYAMNVRYDVIPDN